MAQAIGQIPHRSFIENITNALPCEVFTTEEHGYSTFDFVRLTNLNGCMPPPHHGSSELDGNRYRIVVTSTTSFTLQDAITYEPIDSRTYQAYVEGGYCNRIANNFYYYGEDNG